MDLSSGHSSRGAQELNAVLPVLGVSEPGKGQGDRFTHTFFVYSVCHSLTLLCCPGPCKKAKNPTDGRDRVKTLNLVPLTAETHSWSWILLDTTFLNQ